MKYDLLEPYKEYLNTIYGKNTARKYYSSVVKLFRDKQFNDLAEIDLDFIKTELPERFKTRNEFSAAKNGLIHLKELYPALPLPDEEYFHCVSMKKRNRSKKPKKYLYLDPIRRTVNQIDNPKLKYAYRLALISGLRVSELGALKASDLHFNDSDGKIIHVDVKHGKGGSNGCVECLPDAYLYEHLQKFTKEHPEGNLFYSEAHMRKEADRLHLECHDFRRIFSQQLCSKLKAERDLEQKEINAAVQERMRHKRFSTTKRYLYNRKLCIKPQRSNTT